MSLYVAVAELGKIPPWWELWQAKAEEPGLHKVHLNVGLQ